MVASDPLILSAPAKVNLFLDVGRLRPDGYHDIVSILQTVDLQDRLTIRPSSTGGFSLSVSDPAVPAGPENTLQKAYQTFQSLCPEIPPLSVHLEKNIPLQAGLGGGSSDAGVFLRYLRKTYAPDLAEEDMVGVAAEVGSDVPFFLYGGTCLVEGRGERVTPLPSLPPCPVLLIHPPVSISTASAYRALDEIKQREHPSVDPMKAAIAEGSWDGVFQYLHNSFEEAVFPEHEQLSEIKSFCSEQGFPYVLLAGSGSNLFVLDKTPERLKGLAQEARKRFPSPEVTITATTPIGL